MLCYLTVCIAVSKSAPYFGGGNFDTTMTIFNNDDTFNDGYTGDTIFYIRLLWDPLPKYRSMILIRKVYSAWQGKSDFISISTRLCVILV